MICRLRIVSATGVTILDAIGAPGALADAAYEAGALGVTVMVKS